MPIHDWKNVPVGLYHHFHQNWMVHICDALNEGVLPEGYYALIDQRSIGLAPDILGLELTPGPQTDPKLNGGGLLLKVDAPKTRFVVHESEREVYAAKANRLAIRNVDGELVAIIELVSPGNKDNKRALKAFIKKTVRFLFKGVNLLVIDLFPPTSRDPQGIHKKIWDEIREEPFELPAEQPLTLAAYSAGPPKSAYVEPVAVGDELIDMPLILDDEHYVLVPLEKSYQLTWNKCPQPMRETVLKAERAR